jgi:hypothetical protein
MQIVSDVSATYTAAIIKDALQLQIYSYINRKTRSTETQDQQRNKTWRIDCGSSYGNNE